MSDDMVPYSNEHWFDIHIVPKIDKIQKNPDGFYFINVGLCWNRHRYTDDHEGLVKFSVYPAKVISPQDWAAHWSHAVNFYRYLQAKLKSFGQEFARVDIRVYLSGAPGCRDALRDAFHCKEKRKGFPHFDTPFTWKYIPLNYNAATGKYEEKPDIYSREIE